MQIQTSRFGKIDVDQADLLMMPHGLIGFETCRHWILLSTDDESLLHGCSRWPSRMWLTTVISPRRFIPNTRARIHKRDLASLNLHSEDQIYFLCVVSKTGTTLTANLKSPILLNATRHLAAQLVVTDDQPTAIPISLTTPVSARRAA